jgi:hypothetical protein
MSNAVAAKPMSSFGTGRNFDMPAEGVAKYPNTTTNIPLPTPGGAWRHSDFKAVALPYVYPMYEKMITLGSLK